MAKIILCHLRGKSFSLSEPQVAYLLNGHNNTSQDKQNNGCESTCKLYVDIQILVILSCLPT